MKWPLLLLFLLASCNRIPDHIQPYVSYAVEKDHFATLQSPFAPLAPWERGEDWGRELYIADAFASDLDLYRALSTYRRAEILIGPLHPLRRLQIEYDTVLSYFLAKKYDEAIEAFEKSGLTSVDKQFPAYHDLLLILYESYREMNLPEKMGRIQELMDQTYPDTADKLALSASLRVGDLTSLACYAETNPDVSCLLSDYEAGKKSVRKAKVLNAILPGAGYYYLGQKKSAITAFFLNGLFIAAATEFFRRGQMPAGIITLSFELGWYFGGIYGAGEEAKYYNERVYERCAADLLTEKNLFPVLLMHSSF